MNRTKVPADTLAGNRVTISMLISVLVSQVILNEGNNKKDSINPVIPIVQLSSLTLALVIVLIVIEFPIMLEVGLVIEWI